MNHIDALREAVEKLHGVTATHAESVPVKEEFQGKTVWDGIVEVFHIQGHPKTDNAFVESFNGTFRCECLDLHWFMNLKEAKHLIEAWRQEYNDSRPHRSLGDRTPSEFASEIAASRDLTAT